MVVQKAKSAGGAVGEAAAKAKTPLIAGGTAVAGLAAGVALKNRTAKHSKNPLQRIGAKALPTSALAGAAANLDLKSIKSAAERVSAYGQQAADVASAMEKTHKKNS